MSKRFYGLCKVCGNLVEAENEENQCCGVQMEQIMDGDRSASHEKHTPLVKVSNGEVSVFVGKDEHPMSKEHLIEWVYLKTDKGRYIKYLDVGQKPGVSFPIGGEKPLEVSAYCNKHGLWRAEL